MDAKLDPLIRIKRALEGEWIRKANVNGMDVGYKYVNGKMTDRLAIRVFVDKKEDVPAADLIPITIEGIPTDVIVRGKVVLQVLEVLQGEETAVRGVKHDPLVGGAGISRVKTDNGSTVIGTLGAIVQKKDGAPHALSNFHIMCVNTDWKPGDAIAHPPVISNDTVNIIGEVKEACLKSKYGPAGNELDAAICDIRGKEPSSEILNIGKVTEIADWVKDSAVRKQGFATNLTYGIIDGVDNSVPVDCGPEFGEITFRRQIQIVPDRRKNRIFSDNGDSGSVVVDEQNRMVGLLFAGSTDHSYSYANTITDVAKALDVTPYQE